MKVEIRQYKYKCCKCNYCEWIPEEVIGEFADIDMYCNGKSKMPILECPYCNGNFKYDNEVAVHTFEEENDDSLLF
nr:hypothetical protein [uncultured Cellulosilyticum sp.]